MNGTGTVNIEQLLQGLIGLLFPLLVGPCAISAVGCDTTPAETMAFLERGKAVGAFEVSAGGSPLTAGQKLIFFLGPENSTYSFKGAVDFSGAYDAFWDCVASGRPIEECQAAFVALQDLTKETITHEGPSETEMLPVP